jgi:hypothetical protein
MQSPQIDKILKQPSRGLIVAACLKGGGRARYFDLAQEKAYFHTEASLTVHSRRLANAGYITISKIGSRSKPHTTLELTRYGKRKGRAHLAALAALHGITKQEATPAS